MRSPTMPMSARYHGAPEPSTTRPLVMSTSNDSLVAAAGVGGALDWQAPITIATHAIRTTRFMKPPGGESYVESWTDVELGLSRADAGVCDHRPRAVRDAGRARSNRDGRWRGALRDDAAMAGAGRFHLPGRAGARRHRSPQRAARHHHRRAPAAARPGAADVRARDPAAAVHAGAPRSVAGAAGPLGPACCRGVAVGDRAPSVGVVANAPDHGAID